MSTSFRIKKIFFAFFSCISLFVINPSASFAEAGSVIVRTITVDQKGYGDFRTIQEAIDSVPPYNTQWIRILVKKGFYIEKVIIEAEKEYIVLEGQGVQSTAISWGDHEVKNPEEIPSWTFQSATLSIIANNVVVRYIAIRNSFNKEEVGSVNADPNASRPILRALAVLVQGDRVAFRQCSFSSYQDTLCDLRGRHYFDRCYISGLVDFIFGDGQSIYEKCTLITVGNRTQPGWVTAQGRSSDTSPSGFVFKTCKLRGSCNTLLGRAWQPYARVLFFKSFFDNIVAPQGWDAWNKPVENVIFAEHNCYGPGSNPANRVPWEKKLDAADRHFYSSGYQFIDNEGWLQQLPP